MESKFKVGEIVRHDHEKHIQNSPKQVDPICKITKIKDNRIYHTHRNSLGSEPLNAPEYQFEKIPKLLQILYDDF